MGGRGSTSESGGGRIGKKNTSVTPRNVRTTPDGRSDVEEMFRRAGIDTVAGTGTYDANVVGAMATTLQGLEGRYGAIGAAGGGTLRVADLGKATAAASWNEGSADIYISTQMKSLGVKGQAANEEIGWFMPSASNAKSKSQYTITHEYGHLLQGSISSKTGKTDRQIAREIVKLAGGTKGMSEYGMSNSSEFFAEAFANAHSGAPNNIGRAMQKWLKQQGY